jgi:tight adherence protein B
MNATALLLVYGGLFVGVLLLVEGLYHLLVALRFDPQKAVNRRLRMLASGIDPEEVLHLLRRRDRHHGGVLDRLAPLRALNIALMQSGSTTSLPQILTLMGGASALIYLLARLATLPLTTALALALGFGVALPVLLVFRRRHRRLATFGQQLPDALDLIVRSLRAGHPLSAALGVVAEEMPDPIGTEFGLTVDETTYGLALPEAIENLAYRVGHPDLHYFVVAIRIQYGTGGNLAEVLSGLAHVIRDRFNMSSKVRAVSAEGRLSAWVLSAMPLVLAGAITLLHADYYASVAYDPLFPGFVYVTVTLIIINIVVMHRLVNFKF